MLRYFVRLPPVLSFDVFLKARGIINMASDLHRSCGVAQDERNDESLKLQWSIVPTELMSTNRAKVSIKLSSLCQSSSVQPQSNKKGQR